MRVLRLYWLGTRTRDHQSTVDFFQNVLGLRVRHSGQDFTVLDVADGSTVEVFGPASEYNRHMISLVAGFLVDNLSLADQELRRAGAEIVLPVQQGDTGAWLHFRAPDGFVYELSEEWQPNES